MKGVMQPGWRKPDWRWLAWASTNLANATDHPISTLVVSVFLADGDVQWWLPLALLGIGSAIVVALVVGGCFAWLVRLVRPRRNAPVRPNALVYPRSDG